MSQTHWIERWHGAKLSTSAMAFNPGSGGSTTASTGVTLALSTKASLGHTHVSADVTGLDSTLAGLAGQISTKAAGSHTHAIADVTGLSSSLAGLASQISTKAAGSHTHVMADVTGLESSLAGLASQISTKAAGVHTHATGDVTGLDAALSTKASVGHVHAAGDITTGTMATARLGSGTANNTTFLRGDQTYAQPTAAASGVIPSTWVVASTHTLTGSTTLQSAAGLSFALSSAAAYRFEFVVGVLSSALTTGYALGVNGPNAPSLLAYEIAVSTGVGGMLTRSGRAFNVQTLASPAVDSTAAVHVGYLGGVCRTAADAGTLQLQFASEVAGSTVSVRGGSVGFLWGPL